MKAIRKLATVGGFILISMGSAEAQDNACARVDDPAARLACYDRAAGRVAAEGAPAPVPTPPAARPAPSRAVAESPREALRKRGAFDSTLTSVTPLRHGYYRLELADGSAYDTAVVAPPPPVGAAVHVRKSPLGTTFFDMDGRAPFTVKLSRRQ